MTIGDAQFFCADNEITDEIDKGVAWIFMQHGEWEQLEAEAIFDGDRQLCAIDMRWEPRERNNVGFELIGRLSRMFARYFAEHTMVESGVVQLRAPMRPNWFAPIISTDRKSQALPLWVFLLEPNYGPVPFSVQESA